MFNLSKKDTVPTVVPKKAGSVARLSQEMEAAINQCSPSVAPEIRKRVGYLHLYSDIELLSRMDSLNNKIYTGFICASGVISLPLTSLLYYSINGPKMDLPIIIFALTWMAISLMICVSGIEFGFIPFRKFRASYYNGISQRYGWDETLFGACKSISDSGLQLPPLLWKLAPYLHVTPQDDKNASLQVLRTLGDEDSAAMFALSDSLNVIAKDMSSAQANLRPVVPLVLKGESQELLARVGSALGIEDMETVHHHSV